jgi:hypothetical protein
MKVSINGRFIVLALGMLNAIRRCLDLLRCHEQKDLTRATIPSEELILSYRNRSQILSDMSDIKWASGLVEEVKDGYKRTVSIGQSTKAACSMNPRLECSTHLALTSRAMMKSLSPNF